jgi:hypothetical protein
VNGSDYRNIFKFEEVIKSKLDEINEHELNLSTLKKEEKYLDEIVGRITNQDQVLKFTHSLIRVSHCTLPFIVKSFYSLK